MFATPAISDPWRLAVPVRRPTIEGPRVTRSDVAILGAVGLVILAVAAPAMAVGLVVLALFGLAVWHGSKAVGPMTRPLVEGDSPMVLSALGPYGFAR